MPLRHSCFRGLCALVIFAGATAAFAQNEATGRSPGAQNLIDISLDALFAAGTSTAPDSTIDMLQVGGHDPSKRGFTVQNVELSLTGAVDPYFRGEAHIVFGPGFTELEEAFVQTTTLPWALQVEAGYFLTEFGRSNPRHPHQWYWLDSPVATGRILGAEGMRGAGVRVGWLAPLPWFSEVHAGMQDASGETMTSFIGEVSEEESAEAHAHRAARIAHAEEASSGIAGRPAIEREIDGFDDFAWLGRSANYVDIGETVGLAWGLSGMIGPNSTGPDAETILYGADVLLRWRPATNFRGWPYASVQAEFVGRRFRAAEFVHEDGDVIPAQTFTDRGVSAEGLYGFRFGWSAGLRFEYATGDGEYEGHVRADDPDRADRWRIAPLLIWSPTEYSRIRLQYNYDRADFLADGDAHTGWLGFEYGIGAHPAHGF